MKTVVLLSTRRLPPTYFDTVREDLGNQELSLDVIAWMPPSGWVADKVNTFTLIGPGRMPKAPAPEPVVEADPTEEAPDAVIAPEAVAGPESVVGEAEVAPAAAEVPADAAEDEAATPAASAEEVESKADSPQPTETPAGAAPTTPAGAASTTPAGAAGAASGGASASSRPAGKPRVTGLKRVRKALGWRYRRARKVAGKVLPKAIKTSAPVKFLRGNRASKDLGKTYWGRIESRRDVLTTIAQADVVIALDAGAIWAGWNLGQRRGSVPVVLGLPAARRELDQLKATTKAAAGNG
ncbi:hypothetical protein [Kribbella sp. NPDC049227]|uniref:hypothetical protein n=1 Tax=Kribbella sp. NPDC049227 TaxID=3364113 RepID=UPI0037243399